MRRIETKVLVLLLTLGLAPMGCKSSQESSAPKIETPSKESKPSEVAVQPVKEMTPAVTEAPKPIIAGAPNQEPDFISVQHILIGFQGSVRGKVITRSKAEAEQLATEVLAMAQATNADFGELVRKYTNDAYPGIYKMANNNVSALEIPEGVRPRKGMVGAFGDVGFPLQVGGVGLASFDSKSSPYGWHIIKRVK